MTCREYLATFVAAFWSALFAIGAVVLLVEIFKEMLG
jgi:hypothetical protein